jgi:hypothetical protein
VIGGAGDIETVSNLGIEVPGALEGALSDGLAHFVPFSEEYGQTEYGGNNECRHGEAHGQYGVDGPLGF